MAEDWNENTESCFRAWSTKKRMKYEKLMRQSRMTDSRWVFTLCGNNTNSHKRFCHHFTARISLEINPVRISWQNWKVADGEMWRHFTNIISIIYDIVFNWKIQFLGCFNNFYHELVEVQVILDCAGRPQSFN